MLYAALAVAAVCLACRKSLPVLDVLALGREQSLSLGVDHPRHVRRYLALIAVLVAVSTSLIGPTAFMGIFVANIAYALAGSVRHRIVLRAGAPSRSPSSSPPSCWSSMSSTTRPPSASW